MKKTKVKTDFFGDPVKKSKKKKKRVKDDDIDLSGFLDDDPPLVVSDDPDAARVEGEQINKKSRRITVTLRTDAKYDHKGLHQGDMLREVVAARGIIPEDWDIKRWSEYVHKIGQIPLHILCWDVDRYHKALYGIEILRQAKHVMDDEDVDYGLKIIAAEPPRKVTPYDGYEHDEKREQEKITGKRWGVDELEPDPQPVIPIKEQVEKARADLIEAHRQGVREASTTDRYDEPEITRWKQAEKIARTAKREEWVGKLDPEFETMVRYCYQWLRDIGEVPEYPIDPMDVYWLDEVTQAKTVPISVQTNRMKMTRKVVKYWRKIVNAERKRARTANEDTKMNLHSKSYRTVLAAKKLHHAIEAWAKAPSDELSAKVKKAAKGYFKSHFPIENPPPGPISTLDPTYHEYVVLCNKYGLKQGILLHKADLTDSKNRDI